MSRKLVYIRALITIICVVFFCSIAYLIINLNSISNMTINESTATETTSAIIDTTTIKKDEKKFDLNKSPREQREIVIKYTKEYLQEVYNYIFEDEKFANCLGLNYLNCYELMYFTSASRLYNLLKGAPLGMLTGALFDKDEFNKIDLTDLPLTENYILKHPNSLREEFKQYFKEDYYIQGKGKIYDMDYNYGFLYGYSIGYNNETKNICIHETKSIDYVCDDDTGGSLWGKEGSKYEEKELYAELRNIYFKCKFDDRGYLDDVWFDHIEVLANEEDLDNSLDMQLIRW